MTFLEKLENYFNSGSTDKQNKRRLGGLLISVTAILLVLATFVLAIAACVTFVSTLKFGDDDESDIPTTNADLVAAAIEDVTAKADNALLLLNNDYGYAGDAPAESAVTKLQQINRPKTPEGKNMYACESADNFALTKEAAKAFHEMIKGFYEAKKNTNIWVKCAYNVNGANASVYATATAIQLNYLTGSDEEDEYANKSIYGVKDYEWIYDNAAKYGFIQISDAEGEENIFRYVGTAHAKYIGQKNGKNFYGLAEYQNDLKNDYVNPKKLSVSNVPTEAGSKSTARYYVYYIPANAATDAVMLPNTEKFDYTVSYNNVDGYIITYTKLAEATN